MQGINKQHEKKVILKDIYLSYYYGAKIGVLGLNGAGKSTLLKVMAGVDKNFEGLRHLQADIVFWGSQSQRPAFYPGSHQCEHYGLRRATGLDGLPPW